jgi:hypothetical protein
MDNPVVRFAVTGALIAAVVLGLFESIARRQFGTVRAQEKKVEEEKKEAKKRDEVGLGFAYRQRRTQTLPPVEYTDVVRESPAYGSRADTYESGKLVTSRYASYADGTTIFLFHRMKTYTRRDGPKGPPPAPQTQDPRAKLQKALAGAHKELGRRTIGGVEAEGVEVPEAGAMIAGNNGASVKVDRAVAQFWYSVETRDLILTEQETVGGNGAIRFKTISDRFRWNVRCDPNEFKVKIPPDYQLVNLPQPGQRGAGQAVTTGPGRTPKLGQNARK